MIYISSSCVRGTKIEDVVETLAQHGFRHIELSGGTEYYDGFEERLLELQAQYDLSYRCHNYFPPPKEHFVLNIASMNTALYEKSMEHLFGAIALSKRLGARKFGFHAGFLIDIEVSEIGKSLSRTRINDRDRAMERFCESYRLLAREAGDVGLYIENNVFSHSSHKTYDGTNPFFLTNAQAYDALKQQIDFTLLLDVAHLKVSCRSLGRDFETELSYLAAKSDYLHVSDNDGLRDENRALEADSALAGLLKHKALRDKTITLEVYSDMATLQRSHKVMQGVIDD